MADEWIIMIDNWENYFSGNRHPRRMFTFRILGLALKKNFGFQGATVHALHTHGSLINVESNAILVEKNKSGEPVINRGHYGNW